MSDTATSNTAGLATSIATNDIHKAQAALEAAEMTLAAASQNIKSALNLTELGPNLAAKPAVVAAEASISATAESLKAVKVALEALKEAQVQTIAAQDPGAALTSKGPTNEGQLGETSRTGSFAATSEQLTQSFLARSCADDTISKASSDEDDMSDEENMEMDPSSSGSSWAEAPSSSSSDTSRCPSVMSVASSQGFPEAPFVSYGKYKNLTCSWVGSFALHEIKEGPLKGKNIFVETPIHKAVPKSINAIRFEPPLEHLLVRIAGEEGYWIIVTEQPPCERDFSFNEWFEKQHEELRKQSAELIKKQEDHIKRVEELNRMILGQEDSDDEESKDEEEGQSDGRKGPPKASAREIGP